MDRSEAKKRLLRIYRLAVPVSRGKSYQERLDTIAGLATGKLSLDDHLSELKSAAKGETPKPRKRSRLGKGGQNRMETGGEDRAEE